MAGLGMTCQFCTVNIFCFVSVFSYCRVNFLNQGVISISCKGLQM